MRKVTTTRSLLGVLLLFVFPVFGYGFTGLKDLLIAWGVAAGIFTEIIISITLLVFFIGLSKFILRSGDEEARKSGKKVMMWGIICLFVAISIWAIVRLLQDDIFPGADFYAPAELFPNLPNQPPPTGPIGPQPQ